VGIHDVDRLAPVIVRRDVEIHRDSMSPYHTRMHFTFGDYQDPAYMGIGALRVFNHRFLPPAARPPLELHAHAVRVAYVIAGALVHRDRNLDDGHVDPGGVQRSALPALAEALEWNRSPPARSSCSTSGCIPAASPRAWSSRGSTTSMTVATAGFS
jgi:hypothetical protein